MKLVMKKEIPKAKILDKDLWGEMKNKINKKRASIKHRN